MLREGIGYHTYLGIPERPTGHISINILLNIHTWCISPGHAPVQLSGLPSFTRRLCVTHAAINMAIKLTETPVSSR